MTVVLVFVLFTLENVRLCAQFSPFAGSFTFLLQFEKNEAEAHRMLSETYGDAALSERTCREWFQRFKNGDFDVEDKHGGGREKTFKDEQLETLLDEDSCQTQEELA